MTDKSKGDARTVQLKKVRLSFSTLDEKKPTVEGGDPKHSFNVILEKDSPNYKENCRKVESALGAAGLQAFKDEDRWKSIQEDDPKRVCYREGRRFKNKETNKVYAGYDGNMAISCGTPSGGQKLPPKMLDRYKKAVPADNIADVFYNGCVVDVVLSFYGTDKGGQGFFNTCDGIRSWQEGDRMGGGVIVDADDFDDAEDEDDAFGGDASDKSDSKSDDDDLEINLDDD